MRSKSMNIINSISKQISNNNVLIAFSGGQDSTTLLILLFVIKSQNSLKINLLWNNHLWQKDSFFMTQHVFKLGYLLKIPIHNVIASNAVRTELQARHWRLRTNRRLQIFYQYNATVQAHSGTDKVETLLLNLFKGTGNTSPFSSNDFFLNQSQTKKRKLH